MGRRRAVLIVEYSTTRESGNNSDIPTAEAWEQALNRGVKNARVEVQEDGGMP